MNSSGQDIRQVLQAFQGFTGLNIVVDADVQGKVDVNIRNVPWDQALEIVLSQISLTYQLQGDVLRVMRMETLLKEKEQLRRLSQP